jgi:hypothetical protein
VKTLRIMMPAGPHKATALIAAAKYRNAVTLIDGLKSMTNAGQHTAADGRLFFYVTLETGAYKPLVDATGLAGAYIDELQSIPSIDECLNCGNVADAPVAVCPNCHFREIAPCPFCGTDVAREAYVGSGNDLFACPACAKKVRLIFADPVWNAQGKYNEPVVLVRKAQEGG